MVSKVFEPLKFDCIKLILVHAKLIAFWRNAYILHDTGLCIYKALILVHTKLLYSDVKLIAFWRNAYILHDTGLCIYKALVLVHTKLLYSNVKLISFWRNACILHDTGLEFCQATVSSIKHIVHMYILLTGKIHPINTPLAIN